MKKMLLLVVLSGMLLGTSCPAGAPALTCANSLDASRYGFTVTIPAEYTCGEQLSSLLIRSPLLAVVLYTDQANERSVTVLVRVPAQAGEQSTSSSTVTYEDLPNYTTANGFTFELRKGTSTTGTTVSYIAAAEITSGGNLLGIFVDAASDDGTLLTLLEGILDTVTAVSGS